VNPDEPKPPHPPTGLPPGEIPMGKFVSAGGKTDKAAKKEKSKPVEPPLPAVVQTPMPPAPTASSPATSDEYDVELVPIPFPPAVMPKKPGSRRSLLDMDRRDFIMLGTGVVGTLLAILAAIGLNKLANRKPPEGEK
jgi:hypothetical protein